MTGRGPMGRRRTTTFATAAVLAVLAVVLVAPDPGGRPPAAAAPGATVDELTDRLLTVRPDVGPTWVVSIDGLSTGRRALLLSLQGIVNRTRARLYVTDASDQGAQRWLDTYQDEGLLTVAGTTDLAGAVSRFASEASGYVIADPAEPWTVNVAMTIAAASGAVVVTVDDVPLLEAQGLTLVEDVRGRWTDAATAYEDLVDDWAARLPHAGVAVLRPDDRLYDFTVQQGILTLFTRPSDPDWGRISALITARPAGTPVFGYLSDTGDEEAVAVGTLASAGLVLIPTDTTRNLSFQVAVGADRPRATIPTVDRSSVEPCEPDTLNVVVGLTDGDNINVPLNRFSGPTQWGSSQRGTLPLGWSMSPALSILAPAAWDTYVREASPADDLVGMIGWGYSAPSLLPDPQAFYETSFTLMDSLGQRAYWSLGGGLETPGASGWGILDAAAATTPSATPDLVLVGYGGGTGTGRLLHSPAGRPGLTSGSAYLDTPDDLAAQIDDLASRDPADRPLVSFLSATNWSNGAAALIDRLRPYQDDGVRFLTPSDAAACLPPAEPPVEPVAGPGECLPSEAPTPFGLALISDATVADMAAVPTPSLVDVTVDGPSTAAPGSTLTYTGRVRIDLPAAAASILADRVRPIVEAGYGPEIAATAWVELDLAAVETTIALPPGTTASGTPTVTAGPGAATWGPDGLVVRVPGPLSEDVRAPGEPVEVDLTWAVLVDDTAAGTVDLPAASSTFDLDLTIGVLLGTLPLTGGASAPWACTPATEVLASTTVAGAPTTTTTTITTTTPTTATTATPTTGTGAGATTAAAATARSGAPAYTG
ncbi:MAG: hypothetical protein KF906_02825 [Actinobacteria bacterium]|nr:hypothetical protein [Actinomycetota bacterium]